MENFNNGSEWLRFDCHLHTREDKEFVYGEKTQFIEKYVKALQEAKINVGIITNHNKFVREEYKSIQKSARKKNILILPGVELNIKEGKNGIHILVVFNEEWYRQKDYIDAVLTALFPGEQNFSKDNQRTKSDLVGTIESLNKHQPDGGDYFIIFAHVEQDNGFFHELEGGLIKDLCKKELIIKNFLAFQKYVTTEEKEKTRQEWLGNFKPARIEGSDPKKIEDIGKGKHSYIKIGDYSFAAVKQALQLYKIRTSKGHPPTKSNAYIQSISFMGGRLDGETIELSSSMNNLIGIRGSGKSSIIEAIRYGLGLPLENNSTDFEYKERLIEYLLGNGGKIFIKIRDSNETEILIERTYGYDPEIKKGNEVLDVNILSILDHPLYFGQKDLSSYEAGYENNLMNKLLASKTGTIRFDIQSKQEDIRLVLKQIDKYSSLDEQIKELQQEINALDLKIKEIEKHKISDKLQKQIAFDKDITYLDTTKSKLEKFMQDITLPFAPYNEDFFRDLTAHESLENQDIFDEIYAIIGDTTGIFTETKKELKAITENIKRIHTIGKTLQDKADSLKDEFSAIQREINIPDINIGNFVEYKKQHETKNMMLSELKKSAKKKTESETQLGTELKQLELLYQHEFHIIEKELKKINDSQDFIELKVTYKGDKLAFGEHLRWVLSGSRLNDSDYNTLCEYNDYHEIYDKINDIPFGGNKTLRFQEAVMGSLPEALTFQVPNKIEILYKGKELTQHSLGQRASALIIFLLAQQDNSIIIIDQPEDDLDNQTIYNEVIQEVLKRKDTKQFIFATHNANIPVLGDCEQVIACEHTEGKIEIQAGSIDKPMIQKKIIDIMEGGSEAFEKRGEIYALWM